MSLVVMMMSCFMLVVIVGVVAYIVVTKKETKVKEVKEVKEVKDVKEIKSNQTHTYAFYWYCGNTRDATKAKVMPKIPDHCTHVMISFLFMDFTYNGPEDISNVGIENLEDFGDLKAVTKELSARGIKTFIALGGWGYTTDTPDGEKIGWVWKRSTAESCAKLVTDYGFNGVDLDQERNNGEGWVTETTQMINDLHELLPKGSEIAVTAMGEYATDGRLNRLIAKTKGKLHLVQLMTYGERETASEAEKRRMYMAITDPDIVVSQGYAADGFDATVYENLSKDVIRRGDKGGVFMWGSIEAFNRNIKSL